VPCNSPSHGTRRSAMVDHGVSFCKGSHILEVDEPFSNARVQRDEGVRALMHRHLLVGPPHRGLVETRARDTALELVAHDRARHSVLARDALPWYCVSMKLAQSRVTAQGQISVPAEVRKRLELVPGSILEWDAEGDRITVRRVGRHTFEDLHRALFSQEPQPRNLEDLKEGIRQHMRARHARR
jgi:AbrB family looped-hinge helix DNA binding protein